MNQAWLKTAGPGPRRASASLSPALMLIAVGKGIEPAHARLGLLEFEETVSVDTFGNRAITGTPGK